MNILVRYIDRYGDLKTYSAKVKHDIKDVATLESIQTNVIDEYNNNIIIIRGYIEDVEEFKKTSTKLKTNKFHFDIKKRNLSYYELKEPAFGSIDECLKRNLSIDFQTIVNQFTPHYGNVNINLIKINDPDDNYHLILNEVRDIGLYTHVYKLDFTFEPDWSSTCDSCINGMAHLKHELQKISDQLYVNESSPITTSDNIISDLAINDSALLKDQISVLLSNAIKLAKISNFTVTDVSEGFKGIDYGEAT